MPTAEEMFAAPAAGPSAADLFASTKSAADLFEAPPSSPVAGTAATVASGVRRKFGLAPEEPGPAESVLRYFGAEPKGEGISSRILGVVDPALRIAAAPFVGVGQAAKDITELGGAAIGRGAAALGIPVSPEAQQPTETLLSQAAGVAGSFLVPGGGVVARPVAPRFPTAGLGDQKQLTGLTQRIRKGEPLGKAAADEGVIPSVTTPEAAVPKPLLTAEAALRIEQTAGTRVPESLKGTRLGTEATRRVIDVAEKTMERFGLMRDPDVPVTLQVLGAIERHPEAFAAFKESLTAAGSSLNDLAEMFLATSSNAGRQLGQLGNLSQRLGRHPELAELAETIKRNQPPMSGWEAAGHFWSRFVNLWRGSLVTAWSTAVRNLETQGVRLALEPVEKTLDATIRSIFRLGGAEQPAFSGELRAAFGSLHNLVSRGRQQQAMDILRAFPEESDRLFYRFASDVARSTQTEGRLGGAAATAERVFDRAEAGLNVLNVFNRAQEFLVRRAAFRTKLDELVQKRGATLDNLGPAEALEKDVAASVDHALEMTYAVTPKHGLGKWLVDLYQNPIGKALSFVAPFPRFMLNAWKFQFDYSPAAFLKVLSKGERAKIAGGDTGALSKAVIGSGLLYGAWDIRNSEYAGERWYELRSGDKRYDMRPFAPFSGYLYLAELAKRHQNGTLAVTAEEMARGALEVAGGFRAGAGLYVLDSAEHALESLLGDGRSMEKVTRAVRRFAGETAGGFLQPLTTFRELFAEYGQAVPALEAVAQEEGKARERAGEPFLGPMKAKIPGLSQTLPEKELPLRAATPRQESPTIGGVPVSRQFTGMNQQTRNPIEAEVNRLGLTRKEIYGAFTGEPEADRLIMKHMGARSEERLGRLIANPIYQAKTDAERRLRLVTELRALRAAASALAAREAPALFRSLKLRGMFGRREMELLQERGRLPMGLTP